MAWLPIAQVTPQYVDANGDTYSGAVLKAYAAGTTTNINMATDNTGGTTATSIALNSQGYPEVSGTVVIPHVEKSYKLSLYPTQTAADSNSGAIWTIDNLTAAVNSVNAVDEKAKVSANDTTEGFLNGKLVAETGITLTENSDGSDETLGISITTEYATKVKIVDIGTWNMDTSVNVIVAHNLTLANIRSVTVMIRDDSDTNYYDFNASQFAGTVIKFDATNVTMQRESSGFFDQDADFGTMGDDGNRGWITITYV